MSSNGRVKIEEGSRDAPIALSDNEDGGKLKRKLSEGQVAASSISEGGAKKRRKTVEIVSEPCCDHVESVLPTSVVPFPFAVVAPSPAARAVSAPLRLRLRTPTPLPMPVLGTGRGAQHPFHPDLEQAISSCALQTSPTRSGSPCLSLTGTVSL